MDISIIIVNWNTKDLLSDCVESIQRESVSCTFEIIVVDNGSTDGSQEVIRQRFPDVILIENGENFGFAKANNIGTGHAKGKFVCYVNSDVRVLKGCLQKMYEFMENNPSIGVLGPRILNPDMSLQVSCKHFPSLWSHFVLAVGMHRLFRGSRLIHADDMEYFDHGSIRDVDFLVGCFLMVRREAMDLVGLMDERFFIYYEEVDWCKRFWEAGWRVTFFPNGESIHNNAGSSSSNPVRFSIEQQKALLKYWHKYNSILSMFGLYSILTTGYLIRLCSHGLASMCSTKYAEIHKTEIYNNKACLSGLLKHISN